MKRSINIKCPNCGKEMQIENYDEICYCTRCGSKIKINDMVNSDVKKEHNNVLIDSLKAGLISVYDSAKEKGKKAFDDAKENMAKSAEQHKIDKEEKLKAKLAEKEKQARLKLETAERIRQMKREAEEKRKQEIEQIKAVKRAKFKKFLGKVKIVLLIVIICFVAYYIYQLVSYNFETDRQKQLKLIEMSQQKELAEIEARKQIELASISEAEKKKRRDKNEFDINKNEKISIRLFDFSVPIYWNENKKNMNAYDGLAEVGGKIAELQISSLEDTDVVSFDVLKKETLNGNMQNVFTQTGWFEGATFIEYERISNDILDGYVYSYSADYKGNDSIIKVFCFPSFEDNRWYYVVLQESINTSYSYITDFYKIINSIKRNVNSITEE